MATWVIKKNKRYVKDTNMGCSFTKDINRAEAFNRKSSAEVNRINDEVLVKVQKNKQGNLVETK